MSFIRIVICKESGPVFRRFRAWRILLNLP
jgi:hypothetical protein